MTETAREAAPEEDSLSVEISYDAGTEQDADQACAGDENGIAESLLGRDASNGEKVGRIDVNPGRT